MQVGKKCAKEQIANKKNLTPFPLVNAMLLCRYVSSMMPNPTKVQSDLAPANVVYTKAFKPTQVFSKRQFFSQKPGQSTIAIEGIYVADDVDSKLKYL
jgi:hypothetical protein